MSNILNFEAAKCERQPEYVLALRAAQACDDLRRHIMGEAPMAAGDVASALDAVRSSVRGLSNE